MLTAFKSYILKENLFSEKEKILLAVSGGIDSAVMCNLFYKAKLSFAIAHCNFQLRGEESNKDEAFVKSLAKKYDVPFYSTSFFTQQFSEQNKISIQMAARDLRYQWFEQIRKEGKFKFVAVAQHKDDSIETFFINLIRGTGISGLHGILPKQDKIIRPLLFATKNEIQIFSKANNIAYREDSSNLSDKYIRNKIRHHIIPVLKEINPNAEETITKDIERIRDVESIYLAFIENKRNELLKKEKKQVVISIESLTTLNPLKTYLYEFLKEYQFSPFVIDDIILSLNKQSGKEFHSPTHRLVKDRTQLIITKTGTKEKKINIKFTLKERTNSFKIPTISGIACLDYDLLKLPLKKRVWKEGDYFYPLGMKQKKKLSDFLIDNKVSLVDKENVDVLLSGTEIVWVVGMRIDNRFKISEKTKKVYVCELV